jgi:NAD(P)H-dependent flavin oxidoreductase YrpB (nitropropane dioxygenase family)
MSKVPWIAFKVLAAGAIQPREGIQYAFDGGADFICLGMFDYQVEEDARLIQQCAAQAASRKRPWR